MSDQNNNRQDPAGPDIVVRSIGKATTVGELRKLLEGFSDDTSFGFRNQPLQVLHEVNNSNNIFICFQ